MFSYFANKYRLWKLRQRKLHALFEAESDIVYFETMKADLLYANEDEVRDELFAENKKDKPDDNKLKTLTKKLANLRSIKASYEQTVELRDGLRRYLEMLK